MKYSVFTAVLLVTIGLAYATYPAKYPANARERSLAGPWNPRTPYFVQRLGRVGPTDEEEWDSVEGTARKYKISDKKTNKKSKHPVVEDEPEDDEPEDDDDDDVNEDINEDINEEEDETFLDLPPWQQLFPNKENLPKKPAGGPPPEDDGPSYGSDEEIFRQGPVNNRGPVNNQGPRQRRFRSELPWEGEPNYYSESYEQTIRPRRYPVARPILETRVDRRTGKQVRIITGWSDTVLQDNFNPEYIVNPTLMRLRRKRRYHPSQAIPLQKIPLRGHYGNPRDAYNYISPGGQHWTTGPFQPYVYSH